MLSDDDFDFMDADVASVTSDFAVDDIDDDDSDDLSSSSDDGLSSEDEPSGADAPSLSAVREAATAQRVAASVDAIREGAPTIAQFMKQHLAKKKKQSKKFDISMLSSPSTMDSWALLSECLAAACGSHSAVAIWERAVRDKAVTPRQVADEADLVGSRHAKLRAVAESAGLRHHGTVLPNGSRHAAVAMLAHQPHDSDGPDVLQPENYSMKPFVKKGLSRDVRSFHAADLVQWKTQSKQHRAPVHFSADLAALAKQYFIFGEIDDGNLHQQAVAADVTRQLVASDVDDMLEVIRAKFTSPSFCFCQGSVVKAAVEHMLGVLVDEMGGEKKDLTINVPVPDTPSLKIVNQVAEIKGSAILYDGRPTLVVLYGAHASTGAYGRGSIPAGNMVRMGISLDVMSNIACHLLGIAVDKERQSGLLTHFTPSELSAHFFVRTLVHLRRQEQKNVKQGGEAFTFESLPADVQQIIKDLGILGVLRDKRSNGERYETSLSAIQGTLISLRKRGQPQWKKDQNSKNSRDGR